MSRTYTVYCLSTALSPITHMSCTSGNEALINREEVHTPQGKRFMPFLSGNALRHRMIREPGARFLIGRYGLEGLLNMRTLNFLFHGGTLTESGGREDTACVADLYRIFPLYRLLGGALPGQIVPGSLIAEQGIVVCRENAKRLQQVCPFEIASNLRSAEEFVGGWQYTRNDARMTAPDLVQNGSDEKLNLMPFSGQSIIPGAVIWHGFRAQHVSDLEMGALLLSIAIWQSKGATVGGASGRGHGRLNTEILCNPDIDAEAMMQSYVAHVDAVKDDAIAWITKVFEAKPEPKKRKGKADATVKSDGGDD